MGRKIFELILTALCFVLYNLNMGLVIYDIVMGTFDINTGINLMLGFIMVICCIVNVIQLIKDRL